MIHKQHWSGLKLRTNASRPFLMYSWWLLLIIYALVPAGVSRAQDETIGILTNTSASFEGYTLFSPQSSTNAYLINHTGELINRWVTDVLPGNAAYLLTNGHLFRCGRDASSSNFVRGGHGGLIQEFTWGGDLVWNYTYSSSTYKQHHDSIKLPNGNVLILAWELKSEADAIAAGRNPALLTQGELWPEHLVEVQPTGTNTGDIVWAWHLWDHLIQDFNTNQLNYGVISNHTELVDINYPGTTIADWIHANGIDYNAEHDQIMISARTFGEIWIIDHSTTIAEAAGHTGGNSGKGGDILYRWGNSTSYGVGSISNQMLFGQHNPSWIPPGYPGEGNVLVFNNGGNRLDGNYTTVDEVPTPVDESGNYPKLADGTFGPTNSLLIYQGSPPANFYAPFISGAQRLPNGNTLICNGPAGNIFEVTTNFSIVWAYENPVNDSGPENQGTDIINNTIFRSYRYEATYPGIVGHDLAHHGSVEVYTNHQFEVIEMTTNRYIRWRTNPDMIYYVHYWPSLNSLTSTVIAEVSSVGTEEFYKDDDAGRLLKVESYYHIETKKDTP